MDSENSDTLFFLIFFNIIAIKYSYKIVVKYTCKIAYIPGYFVKYTYNIHIQIFLVYAIYKTAPAIYHYSLCSI
ncbi:hypothetical protein HanIR_Chr02g0088631 [Helianthus annuus]|nr:hypothetical protein HanIR_Chr02g0088631 [Helianthus annuus]